MIFKKSDNFKNNISTYEYLKDNGFSEQMINNFFVPFFGSVLLDKDLSTVKSTFETLDTEGQTFKRTFGKLKTLSLKVKSTFEKLKSMVLNPPSSPLFP